MFDRPEFEKSKRQFARKMANRSDLKELARELFIQSDQQNYAYQWNWLGVPIIQVPADIVAFQEIIWETKPDLIIETGVAWGGSLVFEASILELIGNGEVIGIDVTIPEKNRKVISAYAFSRRIHLIEGSSTDEAVFEEVKSRIAPDAKVAVVLDSNHTHDHVLAELRLYGPLVTPGQYLVCADTIVEQIPEQEHRPRPWGPGNNPKTALDAYLAETDRFEPDQYTNDKLLVTCSPGGYLRCVNDAA